MKKINLQDNCYYYNSLINYYGGITCVHGRVFVNGSSQMVNITIANYYAVNISESGIPVSVSYNYQFSLKYNWGFNIYSNSSGKSVLIANRCSVLSHSCILHLPDGNYSIKPISGTYYSPIRTSYFNVSGKSKHIVIDYKPFYYTVLLDEQGISPEYKWYVNSSSGNLSAYGGTPIELNAINGSSCITLTTNDPHMIEDRYHHELLVYGINKTLTVRFSKGYHIHVNEKGLPSGTMWYFGITGEMEKNTTNTSM